MPRYPDGVAFTVESKTSGQQKFQVEDQFVVDLASGYPEGVALADARAAWDALYTNHNGGTREYRLVRCEELGFEVRPIE
jgi:hypothetical protein